MNADYHRYFSGEMSSHILPQSFSRAHRMELFGIFLSIPVSFVACMLYSLLLSKFVYKFTILSRALRIISTVVLSLFAVEVVLLITIGAVKSRGILGPGFYVAHLIFFFLCPPALANVLVLRSKPGSLSRWWVAGTLCTILAFCLVLLQYGVSEVLYGIDGDNGPYSALSTTTELSS